MCNALSHCYVIYLGTIAKPVQAISALDAG